MDSFLCIFRKLWQAKQAAPAGEDTEAVLPVGGAVADVQQHQQHEGQEEQQQQKEQQQQQCSIAIEPWQQQQEGQGQQQQQKEQQQQQCNIATEQWGAEEREPAAAAASGSRG